MNAKRLISLILAALLCAAMLAGCGTPDAAENSTPTTNANELTYRVSLVDALGNPYTGGFIVSFTGANGESTMQKVDENGVAEKVLTKGGYDVTVLMTGDDNAYHFDAEALKVTEENPSLEVVMAQTITSNARTLYPQEGERDAYYVEAGCTYVTFQSGMRNYYLFAPTTEGTYEISVIGDVESIGYYGAPHFVQSQNVGDMVDNVITISINSSMIGTGDTGTTVLVLGIDPGAAENAVLVINRVGAHQWSYEDEPWMIYQTTAKLAPYSLPAGAQIQEFDLTDTYELVFNAADGFYHLGTENGPLVLVRLAEPSKYLDSFKAILDKTAIRRYFFDANGDFLRKEEYSHCVLEYLQYVDEEAGVYPLTEDLKYIIQQHGDYAGWYDYDGGQFLFRDGNGNPMKEIREESAWLFVCCYIENN